MNSKIETKKIKLNPRDYGQIQFFCHFMARDYKTSNGVVEERPASIKTAERDLNFFPGLFIKIEEAKLLDGSETLYFAELSAENIEMLEVGMAAVFQRCGVSLPATS